MDPTRRWLMWTGLAGFAAAVLALGVLSGVLAPPSKQDWKAGLLLLLLLIPLLWLYRPVKQRFEVSSAGTPATLLFTLNMVGRVVVHIRQAEAAATKIELGYVHPAGFFNLGASQLFEQTVQIAGKKRQLLAFYSFPRGFQISLNDEAASLPFSISRNEFCF